jgi:hypothetical protein
VKVPPERLRTNLTRVELPGASLAEVLLHGLALGEDTPAVCVLSALRIDIDAMVTLAGDSGELADMLSGISRRLDVALELLARGARSTTQ